MNLYELTDEQCRARAVRIGRRVHPNDEAAAQAFADEYMWALAIARAEEKTGNALIEDTEQ